MAQNQQQEPASSLPSYLKRNPVLFVAKASAIAGLSGATLGAAMAAIRLQNVVSWSVVMGSKWAGLALPFFGIREGILRYRAHANESTNTPHLLVRDKDELISTATAGSIIGAGLGLLWRGPMAVIPGSVMYALLTASGQMGYTYLRHYRQRVGVDLLNQQLSPDSQADSKDDWYNKPFRSEPILDPQRSTWDPIKDAYHHVRDLIIGPVGHDSEYQVPSWASPLANALDMEYRNKLNSYIATLEFQIAEVSQANRALRAQLDVADNVPSERKLETESPFQWQPMEKQLETLASR
ncbi:uncharacterized protein BJ171DRAFT_137034 [Polychytrium aggregatum]|uniref:uncharacterized protein n=1 Tax=Polychytrium aggregatum TaxID=110093 RepID=UPI0022FE0D91|nr:uncharacterized protein BJ171DRAFT_137034 [Polychytrium aggregatum]KAI9203584.1 hypothetical protein BJ171DRAFT_137034 [Polychytrium aggregatum]